MGDLSDTLTPSKASSSSLSGPPLAPLPSIPAVSPSSSSSKDTLIHLINEPSSELSASMRPQQNSPGRDRTRIDLINKQWDEMMKNSANRTTEGASPLGGDGTENPGKDGGKTAYQSDEDLEGVGPSPANAPAIFEDAISEIKPILHDDELHHQPNIPVKGVLRRSSQQSHNRRRKSITFSEQVMCRSISIVSLEKPVMSNIMTMNFDEFGNMIPATDDDWSDDEDDDEYNDMEEEDEDFENDDENSTLYSDDGTVSLNDDITDDQITPLPVEHSIVVEIPVESLNHQENDFAPARTSPTNRRFLRTEVNDSVFSTTVGSPLPIRRSTDNPPNTVSNILPSGIQSSSPQRLSPKNRESITATSVLLLPSPHSEHEQDTQISSQSPRSRTSLTEGNGFTVEPITLMDAKSSPLPSPSQLKHRRFSGNIEDVVERELGISPSQMTSKSGRYIRLSRTQESDAAAAKQSSWTSKIDHDDDHDDHDIVSVDVRVGGGELTEQNDFDDEDMSQYEIKRGPVGNVYASRLIGGSSPRHFNSGSLGDIIDNELEVTQVVRFHDDDDEDLDHPQIVTVVQNNDDDDDDDEESHAGVSLVKVISLGKVENKGWDDASRNDRWKSERDVALQDVTDREEAEGESSDDEAQSEARFRQSYTDQHDNVEAESRLVKDPRTSLTRSDAWGASSKPLISSTIEPSATPILAGAAAQSKLFNSSHLPDSVPVVVVKIPSPRTLKAASQSSANIQRPSLRSSKGPTPVAEMAQPVEPVVAVEKEKSVPTTNLSVTFKTPEPEPIDPSTIKRQSSKEYHAGSSLSSHFVNNRFTKFLSASSEKLHHATASKFSSSASLNMSASSQQSPSPLPTDISRPTTADQGSTFSRKRPMLSTFTSTFTGHTSLRSLAAGLGNGGSNLGRLRTVAPESDTRSLRLYDDDKQGRWRYRSKSSCNLPIETEVSKSQNNSESENIDIVTMDPQAGADEMSMKGTEVEGGLYNSDEMMSGGCVRWMRRKKSRMGRSWASLSDAISNSLRGSVTFKPQGRSSRATADLTS
ncbi:hypothetical protein HDV05_004911 [Chytridiales sp. JEL 0842]|nr:hypothetical protein HDV05_004911 [Chytridiales sp. JEL 0842]